VRHSISLSRTKEEQRENKEKHFELIAGNSVYAERFFKKSQVHLIVGDLPYGVQHGNVTNEKQSSLTRNPKELLQACLPGWHRVLKNGGTMVLAWNQFVLPRSDSSRFFVQPDFSCLTTVFIGPFPTGSTSPSTGSGHCEKTVPERR
jgi:tRNA G10  N-methylase Trm11